MGFVWLFNYANKSHKSLIWQETQWTVIGDIRHKRYYYWTEYNRRTRLVDLAKLNFGGSNVQAIPLDEVRREDIDDRTLAFSSAAFINSIEDHTYAPHHEH